MFAYILTFFIMAGFGRAGFCQVIRPLPESVQAEEQVKPYNFAQDPADRKTKREKKALLELLGYRFEEDGAVFAPGKEGGQVSAAEMKALFEPFDFTRDPERDKIDSSVRQTLQSTGQYRFDEDSGHVLFASEGGGQPLNRAEMMVTLKYINLGNQHYALELIHELSRKKGPIPAQNLAQMEFLARAEKELPHGLLASLYAVRSAQVLAALAPSLPPAARALPSTLQALSERALRDSARNAYAASGRFFDNSKMSNEFLQSALPLNKNWRNRPAQMRAYFDAAEERLGEKFAAEVALYLEQYPTGRRVLAGVGRMPAFTIIKTGTDFGQDKAASYVPAWAFYNSQSRSMTFIHGNILPQIRQDAKAAGIPEEQIKSWDNPRLLIQFLGSSDEKARGIRQSLIQASDVVLVHELTHAWQDRREPFFAEGLRSNITRLSVNHEFESFLNENRFLQEKIQAKLDGGENIRLILQDPFLRNYADLVASPDHWRQGIVSAYQSTQQGGLTFSQVQSLQQGRAEIGLDIMRDSLKNLSSQSWAETFDLLAQAFKQALKIRGIRQGDKAIAESKSNHNEIMNRFLQGEYPEFRFKGLEQMAALSEAAGRPDWALNNRLELLRYAPEYAREQGKNPDAIVKEAQAKAFEAAEKAKSWFLGKENGLKSEEVVSGLNTLYAYYDKHPDPKVRFDGYVQLAQGYGSLAGSHPETAFYLLRKAQDLIPERSAELEPRLRPAAESALDWLTWTDAKISGGDRLSIAQMLGAYIHSQKRDPKFRYAGYQGLARYYFSEGKKDETFFQSMHAYWTATNNKLGRKALEGAKKYLDPEQGKDWLARNKEDPSRFVVIQDLRQYYKKEGKQSPDWLIQAEP